MFNKKFSKEPTEKQKLGEIGETCACEYLKKQGYKILERNYLRKWGEIDIIAQKARKQPPEASSGRMTIHFVEVKAVSRTISEGNSVIRETNDAYRPEDNMHPWKLQRLGRAVQSYLLEKDISDDVDWQFDVITVYVDMEKRISRVQLIPDLVL